ncbi:unnamed protein product, partial [Amoebophrya sp. A120]|eukprot:GSA120T00018425001.1
MDSDVDNGIANNRRNKQIEIISAKSLKSCGDPSLQYFREEPDVLNPRIVMVDALECLDEQAAGGGEKDTHPEEGDANYD